MSLPKGYGPKLLLHARVAAIADYYCIDELKEAALEHIEAVLQYGQWMPEGFGETIQRVYQIPGTETKATKKKICLVARDHWTQLQADNDFEAATANVGNFYKDMIGLLEKSYEDGVDITADKRKADIVARDLMWKARLEEEERHHAQTRGTLHGHQHHRAEQDAYVEDWKKQVAEIKKLYATATTELQGLKAPRQTRPLTVLALQEFMGLVEERRK